MPMGSEQAIGEIAVRLQAILREHGPRSVAVFNGTGNVTNPNGSAMARAWMSAIGSKMMFTAVSIDKPAANISVALHGNWHAGSHPFEQSDTWMIVGANPVIAKSNGAPLNNPGRRLKEAAGRGMSLVVIDPRKTETAKRAAVHLQCLPGEDPAILAGIINVILAEDLYDHAFVRENTVGLEQLRASVAGYTPEHVAGRAGISADDLVRAARVFAGGRRGSVVCATGPSFSTNSNLSFYLALCINSLCGRWVRAGETAPYPNVLLPAYTPRAQPYAPYPAVQAYEMRAYGLKENASGMPTATLPDEILMDGPGRVRALICFGGNPMLSWPDQMKTEKALKHLELFVVMDHQMTPTARLAQYVFPCPLALETAGATTRIEALKYLGVARGYEVPWAQYTPKVVDPPPGSELVEDSAFFFRLAQKMNLSLKLTFPYGMGAHQESPPESVPLDMSRIPTNEELIEITCRNARVPLEEVKKYPHGHVFDGGGLTVQPREPGCTAMLQLADPAMMDDLRRVLAAVATETRLKPGQLLLVARRINNFMNSVGQSIPALSRGRRFAPAYMHPSDMAARGIEAGGLIRVTSALSEIVAEVEADDSFRPGLVSVAQGFFEVAVPDSNSRIPTSVTRLIGMDEHDPMTGIPRMSALPVEVHRLASYADLGSGEGS